MTKNVKMTGVRGLPNETPNDSTDGRVFVCSVYICWARCASGGGGGGEVKGNVVCQMVLYTCIQGRRGPPGGGLYGRYYTVTSLLVPCSSETEVLYIHHISFSGLNNFDRVLF